MFCCLRDKTQKLLADPTIMWQWRKGVMLHYTEWILQFLCTTDSIFATFVTRDVEVAYFFFSCKNFRQAHLKPDLNVNQYNIFQNISCLYHCIFTKTLVHFFHFLCILFGIYFSCYWRYCTNVSFTNLSNASRLI